MRRSGYKATPETLRLCRYWIARGWTQRQIKDTFRVGTRTFTKLRRQLGIKYEPHKHGRLWDDATCRNVQGQVDELDRARHGRAESVYPALAAKFGMTPVALMGRLQRYRKRCREQGIDPHPPPPEGTPKLSWRDEELRELQLRADAMPHGQYPVYPRLAEELGVPTVTLVKALKRYRKRCRDKGLPPHRTAPPPIVLKKKVYEKTFTWTDDKCAEVWDAVVARWNPRLSANCQNVYGPLADSLGITRNALIGRLSRWRGRMAEAGKNV